MHRLLLGAILLLVLLAWALAGGHAAEPDEAIARAERILQSRFHDWRKRAERAARRMAELNPQADRRSLFAAAKTIRRQERVHGVAIIDWNNHARVWDGRTFDLNPTWELSDVKRGVAVVEVLAHPAHHVMVAARPAGDGIAVAFYVFDETFPKRRDLAARIARETGLDRIQIEFGMRTVPVDRESEPDHRRKAGIIDDLVHVTFHAKPEPVLAAEAAAESEMRTKTLLLAALALAGWLVWRRLGRRLARDSILRMLLAAVLIVAARLLLSVLALPPWPSFHVSSSVHPIWSGPGDILLTSIAALWIAVLLTRAARPRRSGPVGWALLVVSTAAMLFVPRFYEHGLRLLVHRTDGVVLFDSLHVAPDGGAALLLASVCMLTGAVFLCCYAAFRCAHGVHRIGAALPFLATALGLLPWMGPVLALGCALAGVSLRRTTDRPGRAVALVFLTALTSFPLLYSIHRDDFMQSVAARARELVGRRRRGEAEARLAHAVQNATDPDTGSQGQVAEAIARGDDPTHLAFSLWAASRWSTGDPCAVQVWDLDGKLLSTFDFDSPPTLLLPRPPDSGRLGPSLQMGQGEGEAIHFYAYDFLLKTTVDDRTVGIARFLLPDRWDVLLSDLRPSMFSEPFDLLGYGASRPLVFAEFALDGTPQRASAGKTADLSRPDPRLLSRALHDGYATTRTNYRGNDALLLLTLARYSFGALVFPESLLQQGGLAFAKILLTYSVVCLLYLLGVALTRRTRMVFRFRHRVALFLVLVSVAPVLFLAVYDKRIANQRYEAGIAERLKRPLDLAQRLIEEEPGPINNAWCTRFAANYRMDINVYAGQELVATSRPGVWDTGLLARRLAAGPYLALNVENRTDVTGREYFTRDSGLRASYRKVRRMPDRKDLVVAAPALDDRRDLDRRAAESNALLLAIYLTTAILAVFAALYLARSLTRPVRDLREATRRIAAGDLNATLREGRSDEFGELVRAFNHMTRELRETQNLRVRVEKAAAWREMARQVAHEIKNPLTPIKLTVQNLLASHEKRPQDFEQDFSTGAHLILEQIEALQRIASDFSAYARFPERAPEPVDLNLLLEDVAAFYTAAGKIKVTAERAPQELIVKADRDELRRALINLVTNSRQAGAHEVALRARIEGRMACLTIDDDGAGIRRADLDRIWEPSFTTKSAGTGLGMPIVKRVVDDHGGTIAIDSAPGRGTNVTIRLPLPTRGESE